MSDKHTLNLETQVKQSRRVKELTAKCSAQAARIAKLTKALEDLRDWFGFDVFARPPLDQWEMLAEEFYKATGYMHPGKDDMRGIHTIEERWKRWDLWAADYKQKLLGRVRQALAPDSTTAGDA